MKVLVAILTTSDIPRAARSVMSVMGQWPHPFDIDIVVFCNTLEDSYADELQKCFSRPIVCTKSDGTPGTGKQSVINWFMAHEEYDAFILVDGDDFLYPCALQAISHIWAATEADVIGLQSHDMLVDYESELKRMQVDDKHWLLGWYGVQINHTKKRGRKNRLENVGHNRTPDRLIWFTRKAFTGFIRPWFPNQIPVSEDYVASLCCLAAHVRGEFKYAQTSTSDIYVHDSTQRDSTCSRYLSSGKGYTDVNDVFQKLIEPIDKLIGNTGFWATHYYEYPNEGRLSHAEKIEFVRKNLIYK